MEIRVLYEDNHVIAAYKPAGVLVQKGEAGGHDDDTLYWQVKQFIKRRDDKPGDAFLGVLHRLDRPVSGIVLFAKTSKGAARLSEQFRAHTIVKIYHAVVHGKVSEPRGSLIHFLIKDQEKKKAIIGRTGDKSILHYEVVRSNFDFSLLKIRLETGRFHQIRAQLSHEGHPIAGDAKYGSSDPRPDGSICLAATELRFAAATSGETVMVSHPYPPEWEKYVS
ncbi:MAG TPA: RluA family pseudouridine synthase [Candidatus Paceibacterota bacterium]|nr:RluA family pseudouridine synthase [Candidatus Paceibacterota bacterium]